MKTIFRDKLRGSVTVKVVCLLILTAAATGFLTNPLTSSAVKVNNKAPVKIAQVTLKQQKESALTNAKGFALYFYDDDKDPTKPDCNIKTNKACTKAWPPLLLKSRVIPPVSGLSGELVITKNVNGLQVTYGGHLLYTYKNDKKPLVASGDGVGGNWHVATPDSAVA